MEYFVTGLMSGTSLDGVDLAYCQFKLAGNNWNYEIIRAETLAYPSLWKKELTMATTLSARALISLHSGYGTYLGNLIHDFHRRHDLAKPHIVASHGHTLFHQPAGGYTFQLGHGAFIAAASQCTVVNDFRSMDVALGGQGAPLVPLGDDLLFPAYTYCLNLGGFANISMPSQKGRLAFDICPVNFVINRLVRDHKKNTGYQGPDFDRDGLIARRGKLVEPLLQALNSLDYYAQKGPKSLGEEWVTKHIWPLLTNHPEPLEDILQTFYRHVALQVNNGLISNLQGEMLVTGGGAHNTFLMECIRETTRGMVQVRLPDQQTIDFKEALIFAFLGLRHIRQETTSLSTVTGASADAVGGSIHYFH